MAYLAVIALDKDWEGKTGHEEAVLCQSLAHPFIKDHAMPCKLLSKREPGPAKNLEYLDLECIHASALGAFSSVCVYLTHTGESMLKVR